MVLTRCSFVVKRRQDVDNIPTITQPRIIINRSNLQLCVILEIGNEIIHRLLHFLSLQNVLPQQAHFTHNLSLISPLQFYYICIERSVMMILGRFVLMIL